MSAVYSSLGYTFKYPYPSYLGDLDYNDPADRAKVRALIEPYVEDIFDHIAEVDDSGFLEEEGEDLTDALEEGAMLHLTEWFPLADYQVGSLDGVYFRTSGCETHGDPPIDGYSELSIFLNACEVVPEFAETFGIVGWGLQVPA